MTVDLEAADAAEPGRPVAGPAAVLAVLAVFAGATLLLGHAFDRATDHPGDRTCAAGSSTYVPPCPQQLSLVWVLASVAATAVVLAAVVGRWRRDLVATFHDHPPGAGALAFRAKRRSSVFGLLAVAVAVALQLPFGPNFDLHRSYGRGFDFEPLDAALVRLPIWLSAVPVLLAVLSILDIPVIARGGREAFLPVGPTTVGRLAGLRRSLDHHLWVLGFLLGLWVVALGAAADYAIAVAELAGGDEAPALTAGTTTVVTGAVVTGILALLYVPAAVAVDDLAAAVAAQPGGTTDEVATGVGGSGSVQDRLFKGLSIAAPLTGAVVTTFLG